MTYHQDYEAFTMKAGVDTQRLEGHFCRHTGNGFINISSHAAASVQNAPIGVIWTKTHSGGAVAVAKEGNLKLVAGGQISIGQVITTNQSGRAVAASSGDLACGRALTATSADGDTMAAIVWPITSHLTE